MKKYRPHILVMCVLAVVLLSGMHNTLQNVLADMRFGWFVRQASGEIVLVAIDSPSIEKVGVWPWPRQLHAEVIDKLEAAGASEIIFDVDFSSPSNPASDHAFVDALQKAGGSVVLPAFKQLVGNSIGGKSIYMNRPLQQFGNHAWSAVVNVAVEPDGLVRRYSYGEMLDGSFMPSVGALLAGKYEGKNSPLQIDFSIEADSIPTISYADVLYGNPTALGKLKNKKVIIGSTALELGDRFNVPNGRVIPGPVLQVLAAESILQGRVLRTSSVAMTVTGLSVIMLLMTFFWGRTSALLRVVILVSYAGIVECGAVLLQAAVPVILDTSLFHAAVVAYFAALALDEIDFRDLLGRIAERRFQRIAMSIGDGLVCTDHNCVITVWNPGAVAIFGYEAEEMIGQPLHKICKFDGGTQPGSSPTILEMPLEVSQAPGGKVIELEGRRKSGETFPLEACFSEWQGVNGGQYGAIMRDISDRKREAERILYLAEHDTLTGLANRNKLQERLDAMLAEANTMPCQVALLLMDLDKFKQINDTLGHACGDLLLRGVAERLKALVGAEGLVARLSGDEFAVVISGDELVDRAKMLSERAISAFGQDPFTVGARNLRVNVSIGVAVYPTDCRNAEELFGNADLALYQAKAAGRGRYVFFERAMRDELESRLLLEADLDQALERNEFELFYQPQINLKDGRLAGAEALIRWRHQDRGLVMPDDFMPVVNASSISDSIALWVLQTACKQASLWQRAGHSIRVGVNLSPSQFQSGDLAATVCSILNNTGLSPSLLELEVTENILLEDDKAALEIFRKIQELGVNIAFDDFGTGYASMTYLKNFPLDRLKIDRTFVSELGADSDDMLIVGATISLGNQLGLSVIAEGIENRATADLLCSMGCDEGQGYLFGRAMPAAEFEQKFFAKGAQLSAAEVSKLHAATAA